MSTFNRVEEAAAETGAERAARKEAAAALTMGQNQQSATGRWRQYKKPQMTENERKLVLMLYTRLLVVPDLSVRQKEQYIQYAFMTWRREAQW